MEQLNRIKAAEIALDQCAAAVAALEAGLEQYAAICDTLRSLTAYYESPLWLQDHDDDCAGKLPSDLKRGVLTEDAVYDLLTDEARLLAKMKQLVKE